MQKFGVEAFIDGLTLKELSTAERTLRTLSFTLFSLRTLRSRR
jgi:hypothetical protein